LQDVNNDGQAGSDTWTAWGGTWRDVVILDKSQRRFATFNLTQQDLANDDNYEALKQLLIAAASASNVAAPTAVDLLASTDTGISSSDNITRLNNSAAGSALQFRVTGVQNGAVVRLYHNNTMIGQGTASGTTIDITTNGSATIPDGAANITAIQVVGGEESAASSALSVTIDTLAPPAITPTFPSTATVGTAITYDAQNSEENQSGFRYALASAPSGMTINQTTGAVTWTPTSAQAGTQNFSIQATDAAGNVRTLAATVNVAGGAPSAVDLVAASDAGFSDSDNLTNVTLPQFNITGVTSGAVVKLYNGATVIGQATASGTSVLITATSALAQGAHNITASQTIGGTESAKSTALAVTVDTTVPGFFVSSPSGQANVGVPYTFDMQNGEEGQTGFRYSLVNPPAGMSINATTGVISWSPTAAQSGSHSYQVRGTDAAGNARTVNSQIQVLSGAPTGIDLLAGSDSGFNNSDNLTNVTQPQFTISGLTTGATVRIYDGTTLLGTVTASGPTATFTPSTPLSQGVHNISASQVVSGEESDKTVAIAVTIDTTAPAAITPTPPTTALVGTAFSYNAQNAEEGQTGFRYSLVNAPAGATIDETTGVVSWTPTAAQAGARSFDVRATDAAGNTRNLTVALTVLGALPGAADTFAATEDTALTVTAANGVLDNDGDGQSGTLSATLVTNVSHGTLTLNANGSFTYTPTANYFGPDTFTYQATDGTRTTAPVTVTINVASVNDAPTAVADTFNTAAGIALTINATNGVLKNDTDIDDTALTAQLVQGPAHGTLTLNADGSFTYTATAGFSGNDTFTYRVNDSETNSNTATVTIAVNAAPTGAADAYSVNEDQALTVNAATGVLNNDDDPENDALTAEIVANPTHGTLTFNANGSFTYTPSTNYHGSDSFTYRAKAGGQNSAPITVSLTVNSVNDAPTAAANQYAVDIGEVLTVSITNGVLGNDTDVENSPLTAVIASQPAHGSVTLNLDGSFTYTPAASFSGTDTFTYRADDGDDLSAPATVTIAVNGPPTAANDSYAATEDTQLVVGVTTGVLNNDIDAEGDPMTAALVDGPQHGTLTLNPNGSFTYTPAANYSGPDTFTYRASDGNAQSAIATVTINVTGANDAPVAAGDSYQADEDTPLTVDANTGVLDNDTDTENSPLTAVLVNGPQHGTVTLNSNGSFTYTPSSNYHGADSFTYRAQDGTLSSAATTVSITVRPIADAPVISPVANRGIFSGGTVVVDVNATDIDGTNATMAYVLVTGPAGATVDPVTGVVSWTAPSDFTGRQAFTVRATKGTPDGLSSTVDFNVDVSPLGGLIADAIETSRRVVALPPGTRPLRGVTPERPRNGGLPSNPTVSVPQSSLSRLQSSGRAVTRSQGTANTQNLRSDEVTPASATEEEKKSGGGAATPGDSRGETSSRAPNSNETSAAPDAAPVRDESLAAIDLSPGERAVTRFVSEISAHQAQHDEKSSPEKKTSRRGRMAKRLAGEDLALLAQSFAERAAMPNVIEQRRDDDAARPSKHQPDAAAVAAPQSVGETSPAQSDLRKAFAAAAAVAASGAFAPMLVTNVRRRRRSPRQPA
jgi:VCBS repeat-containing protein